MVTELVEQVPNLAARDDDVQIFTGAQVRRFMEAIIVGCGRASATRLRQQAMSDCWFLILVHCVLHCCCDALYLDWVVQSPQKERK